MRNENRYIKIRSDWEATRNRISENQGCGSVETMPSTPTVVTPTGCSLNCILKSISICEPQKKTVESSEESVTVVMNNTSSPIKKAYLRNKVVPVTPEKRQIDRHTLDEEPSLFRDVYHSPESIKLPLPGTITPEPESPPRLLRSPQLERLWTALDFVPTSKSQSTTSPHSDANKENWWENFWMGTVYFGCGHESNVIRPNSGSFVSSPLTRNMLQQHEEMVRKSPPQTPEFSGDKLAKTVIHKKEELQLAKERREKLKPSITPDFPTPPPKLDDIKAKQWLEMEREKALAAKWQRKKNEQWGKMRAEQVRLAELERQRNLCLNLDKSTPKKTSTTGRKDSVPGTPKTFHSCARKLIHI